MPKLLRFNEHSYGAEIEIRNDEEEIIAIRMRVQACQNNEKTADQNMTARLKTENGNITIPIAYYNVLREEYIPMRKKYLDLLCICADDFLREWKHFPILCCDKMKETGSSGVERWVVKQLNGNNMRNNLVKEFSNEVIGTMTDMRHFHCTAISASGGSNKAMGHGERMFETNYDEDGDRNHRNTIKNKDALIRKTYGIVPPSFGNNVYRKDMAACEATKAALEIDLIAHTIQLRKRQKWTNT